MEGSSGDSAPLHMHAFVQPEECTSNLRKGQSKLIAAVALGLVPGSLRRKRDSQTVCLGLHSTQPQSSIEVHTRATGSESRGSTLNMPQATKLRHTIRVLSLLPWWLHLHYPCRF